MTVRWDDTAVKAELMAAAGRGAFRTAQAIQKEAVRLLTTGPKTGRIYRRRGVEHQASAPGQPPASDTGRLAGSGTTEAFPAMAKARVTFSTAYARAQERGSAYRAAGAGGAEGGYANPAQREIGTQSLEPRPFLRPAAANMAFALAQYVGYEISISFPGGVPGPAQGSLF